MSGEWNSNELIFDEADQRGVHRIGGDNIRLLEEGIEIEADCPNCPRSILRSGSEVAGWRGPLSSPTGWCTRCWIAPAQGWSCLAVVCKTGGNGRA